MTLEGVDISSHQREYTYPTNPDFAILKASGGHEYRNEYLPAQVASARARGIIVGFYHYMFEPSYGTPGKTSGGDVAREVDNFIAAVRPYVEPGTTFWLDVEEDPATVGLTGATNLRKYPYWMASWQEGVPDPRFMAPWQGLTIHQYDATVVDKDRFYGTREEFLALGVGAPAPPPAADPIRATTVIGGDGVPVTTIVWGGQATEVLGTSYRDIGVRVKNAAGQTFHRSIVDGEGREWVEE